LKKALVLVLVVLAFVGGWLSRGVGVEQAESTTSTTLASLAVTETSFESSNMATGNSILSPLHVVGNAFVDEWGKRVILRGVAITDQAENASDRTLNQSDFQYLAQNWDAKVVRIPVLPQYWDDGGDTVVSLKQIVGWANEYGMYAIIDWHAFSNPFSNETGSASWNMTEAFWTTIAQNFVGTPGVIYEVYNEPDGVTWSQWQIIAERLVNLIREFDPETIILVAGIEGAGDLSDVIGNPVNGTNIGYVIHPYPGLCGSVGNVTLTSNCWHSTFGITASVYPVVATEWGYCTTDQTTCAPNWCWIGSTWTGYGSSTLTYMQSENMSWTAWVWSPTWCPSLLLSWTNYQPSQFGKLVVNALMTDAQLTIPLQPLTLSPLSMMIDVAVIVQPTKALVLAALISFAITATIEERKKRQVTPVRS
jgi:hypothetical protein